MGFRVGKLGNYMFAHSRNKGNDNDVHSSDKVCVAPPIIMCAWSMTVLLGQRT